MAAAEDAEDTAASLRTLCREKCSEMDLKNHRTAYNALKKIGEPHRTNLQHMGYSVCLLRVQKLHEIATSLHDFEYTFTGFHNDNGVFAAMDHCSAWTCPQRG